WTRCSRTRSASSGPSAAARPPCRCSTPCVWKRTDNRCRSRSWPTCRRLIRVPLPALNEERRRELVKVVHKLAEEGRIAIRHARTHAREQTKKLDGVSEDDKKHADKDLQKLHDDHMAKLEDLLTVKEAEIMEV